MKLNFGKRLVLFFHWLFSLAGCVIALIYCVAPDMMWDFFAAIYDKIGKRQTDIIGAACLAVYVVLAIASVMIILSNRQKREERSFITVETSETGKTRIAVGAVDQMIRQATNGIADISSMKTSIQNLGDAIAIESDVVVLNDAHLPTVTATIQRSVRSYIELNCGVSVREITVNVRGVEQSSDPNRKSKKAEAPVIRVPSEPETTVPELKFSDIPSSNTGDIELRTPYSDTSDSEFVDTAETDIEESDETSLDE